MSKYVLFIQGGGNGGYEADARLVASLQEALTTAYKVHYPRMPLDETEDDFSQHWLKQIANEISAAVDEIILAGHSLGASLLLKYLSENRIKKNIAGIFLIAPVFGVVTKTGCSLLNYKQILLSSYRRIFRFFSINAKMMK